MTTRRTAVATYPAALLAAIVLASVAAGSPQASKQRVAITATILPSGKAVLTSMKVGTGAFPRDTGTFVGDWQSRPVRTVVRDGAKLDLYSGTWTFTGKAGTLVLRESNEWADLGQDLNHDNFPDGVGLGTWKVVRGTGSYAGISGVGRSSHLGQGQRWIARYEGLVSVP